MKNISLVFNAVLAVAVAILFYLHFSSKNGNSNAKNEIVITDSTGAKTPLVVDLKPSQFVYVNSDTLLEKFEMTKVIRKELESSRKASENSFQAKVQAFQSEIQDLQERAANMTQEQGEAKQRELAQREQQLGEMQAQLQEQLGKKEADKTEALHKFISDYLKRNYSDKYMYILGYSQGGGILLANDSLDITNEVIKGLNAEYNATKKTKK
ncbi:MAG: OmpH family outer membrane protein [Bacteroidota bacterium]